MLLKQERLPLPPLGCMANMLALLLGMLLYTKLTVATGGLNVYPKEVELFIDDLPGVKESAVIGVPHADFGEAVVAVVVPGKDSDLSEAQIVNACKLELANFKVPKRVVFVDELPRNSMAKVQKNVMRDQLRDRLPASPMKMTTTACTN